MLKELFSFRGRYKTLHLTWLAFFLTFVCWFNFAPFASTIGKSLALDKGQLTTLGICNLALTIPARIIIGMLLDKYGPRITYSALLVFAIVPCFATALSQDFNQLVFSRLLMGIVGAGFVVGIRMVSEWFPPKEIGIAEGIYGGWGNFGAFGAEFALPALAIGTAFLSGGAYNWRVAIALTGVIAAIYGVIYYNSVQDTPAGKAYKKPKRNGGLQVTSARSFYALLVMNFGLIFALGVLAWRLAQPKINFLSTGQMYGVWGLLLALYAYQSYKSWEVNKEVVSGTKTYSPSERYQFRQVALLEFTYVTNFGSELAAVSMLPLFFEYTFGLEHAQASMIAACYPFLNLVSRPSGGLISDKLGSRKWTMTFICFGIGISYLIAFGINKSWPIPLAIAATMLAAYFAQAGCGATYGIVPLIKKEITGQISGNVGAYGNFGGVMYLTIYSLTNAPTLFATMGIAALICGSLCAFFLKEPKGSFAAHHADEIPEMLPKQEQPILLDGKETY
ncbi:NarK family nitrate/nitrite MFS transporter [Merismopedia glauca]|uniref:Nitrate/nitrite transporter n=1 Tax=Merismopedia glauca CCAP 1448/3 TaxID=1296344 RepID=A0A2T1C4M4_9CYAN|nr:NarK family nitrate/nitrite MFS transporter [Merismopedia glauca]PSB03230.1 MFS transporter [Merismopedia glauca CCAP 1448/3]